MSMMHGMKRHCLLSIVNGKDVVIWDNGKFLHNIYQRFHDFCNLYHISEVVHPTNDVERTRLYYKFLNECYCLFEIFHMVIHRLEKRFNTDAIDVINLCRNDAYSYLTSLYTHLISVYI